MLCLKKSERAFLFVEAHVVATALCAVSGTCAAFI
jgi:hypothetical protein